MKTKIISIFNNKGGVGKTTTTLMFSQLLAKEGKRVLVIDFDPQANLTSQFVSEEVIENTIYEVIVKDVEISKCIYNYEDEHINLDYIPANALLNKANNEIMLAMNKIPGTRLKNKMSNEFVEKYDFIFIDCSPSLDMLTTNALAVSDEVIIPMKADGFSLLGMQILQDTINDVQLNYNPNLKNDGVFLNEYIRSRVNDKVYESLCKMDNFKQTKINSAVAIKENTIKSGLYINNKLNKNVEKQFKELMQEMNLL